MWRSCCGPSAEPQAYTNLRKVLHTLRRVLADADRLIVVGSRSLQWSPDVPVWLDVEHFERALSAGQLEEAVETHAGDLLEGRYDEWLFGERERLARLHMEALERLARRYGNGRRWPQAVRCAEWVMAQDPLCEESHRLLMRLCRASRDQAQAVGAYHACATVLEGELGFEPSPETCAISACLLTCARQDEHVRRMDIRDVAVGGRQAEKSRLVAVRPHPDVPGWCSSAARRVSARRGWWPSCAHRP